MACFTCETLSKAYAAETNTARKEEIKVMLRDHIDALVSIFVVKFFYGRIIHPLLFSGRSSPALHADCGESGHDDHADGGHD